MLVRRRGRLAPGRAVRVLALAGRLDGEVRKRLVEPPRHVRGARTEEREQGLTHYDLRESSLPDVIDDARSLSLFAGKRVIVVAHGNTIRALVKYLDNVSENDIVGLNIPTGIPLVYELNDDLTPIRHYYLGDPAAPAAAAARVAAQTSQKR